MIDDLFKSAKESIAERLASPLLGSFAIAWCLWNYKFLVILFSAAGVSQTFKLIEHIAFPNPSAIILKGVIYPLVSALIYVFAYPYPARFVYAFTLRRQREVNNVKRKIEEETLLTLEESRAVRADFVRLERKYQDDIDNLNSEISRLNAALDQAQKETLSRPDLPAAERLYGTLDTTQLALLKLLEKKGGTAIEEDLLGATPESKVRVQFDLGELQRKKLVQRDYNQRINAFTFEFTHEGRRVLLNDGRFSS